MSLDWFEVDRKGLSGLLGGRSLGFLASELIANGWDEDGVTEVDGELEPTEHRGFALLRVRDNSPDGFRSLEDAWTLFARSYKVDDPNKRGRFNLGEKLVLALARRASIITTTGGVLFDEKGRHRTKRRTDEGSVFEAVIKINRLQVDEVNRFVLRLISPSGVVTTWNGTRLPERKLLHEFKTVLMTDKEDSRSGVLVRTRRKTQVRIYDRIEEEAHVYEMGIPVVELDGGDRYDIDVGQKVPLNFQRDNVPPSFIKALRVEVLNQMRVDLDEADARAVWVREAASSKDVTPEAFTRVIDLRFGVNRVTADPSDPEGTKIAASKGYSVVHGGGLTTGEWENVRRYGAILPAGQVTPSPKPFSSDGRPLKTIDDQDLDDHHRRFISLSEKVARVVGIKRLHVVLTDDPGWGFSAAYERNGLTSGSLWVHVGKVNIRNRMAVLQILIHELAHHEESDHLSDRYHDAIRDVGAKLMLAAVDGGLLVEPLVKRRCGDRSGG